MCYLVLFIYALTAKAVELRVGYTSDLSAQYSKELGLGLDLYFSHINNSGGIHKNKIKLIAIDNAGKIPLLTNSLHKLAGEGAQVIITNPLPIHNSAAVIDSFATNNKTLALLGKNVSNHNNMSLNYVGYKTSYAQEILSLLDFIMQNKKARYDELAIYADQRGASKECVRVAKQYLKTFGATESVIKVLGEQTEFKEYELEKIKGVLMCSELANIVTPIKTMHNVFPDAVYLLLSYAQTKDWLQEQGLKNIDVMVAQSVPNFTANLPIAIEYRELFAREYPEGKMSTSSFEGFILGKIIVLAMSDANTRVEQFLPSLRSLKASYLGLEMPVSFADTAVVTGLNRVWIVKIDELK